MQPGEPLRNLDHLHPVLRRRVEDPRRRAINRKQSVPPTVEKADDADPETLSR